MMGKAQNHGKRNIPTWQRLSQRDRARLAARQAVQGYVEVVGELDELRKSHNVLALRFEALVEMFIEVCHEHRPPEGGVVLIGRDIVHPPVPVTLEQYQAFIARVRARWLAKMDAEAAEQKRDQAAETADGDEPATPDSREAPPPQ